MIDDEYSFLFDKRNRLIKKSLSSDVLDKLFNETSWMPDSATIHERVYVIRNNIEEMNVMCKGCMNRIAVFISMTEGYGKYCSYDCSRSSSHAKDEKRKMFIEKYGVDNPSKLDFVKNKKIDTLMHNYGVSNPMHSSEVKERLKATNIERYGVENTFQSEFIKDKIKQSLLEKYRVYHPMHSSEVKERLKATNIERYGVENTFQLEKVKTTNRQHNIQAFSLLANSEVMSNMYSNCPSSSISKILGVTQSTVGNYLKKHGIALNKWNRHSYQEKIMLNYIKSIYSGEIVTNTRKVIPPLELDIYIPEKKLAIELNGVYWHSSEHKEHDYH